MEATGGDPRLGPPAGGAADRRAERVSRGAERVCDGALDFLVLAFAAWTVVYHVCLVLGLGAVAAGLAGLAALAPSAWLAFRRAEEEPQAPEQSGARAWSPHRIVLARAAHALLAVAAAAVFAFADLPWAAVWPLVAAAALAAVILTSLRQTGSLGPEQLAAAPTEEGRRTWPATLVALAWGVGLGALSLFLVRPDPDDAYYVRLSTWIGANGDLPLRDVLFSDGVFPAIIYPPVSSFEALAGTVAFATGLAVPNVVYLLVPPLASALSALAMWRLLRTWRVPMVGLALSAALLFLLLDAESHRTLGNLFVGRIWQGKIVFLSVLVPVLFALLTRYAERPTTRALVLLAAAGAAGVGLTSTATFLVPVIAAGCLAPLALRAPRQAALGLAAAAAYPLGTLAATVLSGGRRAGGDIASDVVAGDLVRYVLGDGALAFVAVAAALVGPVLVPRALAAQLTASTVLLVVLFFAPPVPPLVFEVAGLGRVLWRLNWAIPVAVLVGVVATGLLARARPPVVRVLPAVVLAAVLVAWGRPVWSAADVAAEPSWKRPGGSIVAARRILARADEGDVILAPRLVSQTIVILSADMTTVAPRPFYALALDDVPGAYARERVLLVAFAEGGLGRPIAGSPGEVTDADGVIRALRLVGVDLACVGSGQPEAEGVLLDAGYTPAFSGTRVTCLEAPAEAR